MNDHFATVHRSCGLAAATLWMILWDRVDARTGLTRGTGLVWLATKFYGPAPAGAPDGSHPNGPHITRMIRKLKTRGYLAVATPGRRGRRSTCAVYRLHFPELGAPTAPNSPSTDTPELGAPTAPISPELGAPTATLQKKTSEVKTEERAADAPTKAVEQKPEPTSEEKKVGDAQWAAVAHWQDARSAKYGPQPRLSKKGVGQINDILAGLGGDLDQFRAVVARYLACEKHFEAVEARHSLGLLATQYDRWKDDAPAVAPRGRMSNAQQQAATLAQMTEALSEPERKPAELEIREDETGQLVAVPAPAAEPVTVGARYRARLAQPKREPVMLAAPAKSPDDLAAIRVRWRASCGGTPARAGAQAG